MPSVENFYWILYDTLLRPVGIDCWYYYPWGTQHHLSRTGEFQKFYYRKAHANHVLFHFDQEPIWDHSLGKLYEENSERGWSSKILRIVANSEHSELKRQLLRDRGMQDWYFFYHGFAALDWYRDTKYVDSDVDVENAFLCLNHITQHRRNYRLDLVSRMVEQELHHRGRISLHATGQDILTELSRSPNALPESSRARIETHLAKSQQLPWSLDQINVDGNLSAQCGHREYGLWQTSLLHVVTETVFYEPKLHLTEKIFKPIVAKRPFVLVAAPGNLAYLRSYGFRTFGDWIDESYDTMTDPDARLTCIVDQVRKLSQLSTQQLRDMQHDMRSVLDFNKEHLFGHFREMIVDELIENFETCIRLWNHARLDAREVPNHPDLTSARQRLLL